RHDVRALSADAARIVRLRDVDLALVLREERQDHEAEPGRAGADRAEQLALVAVEHRGPVERDVGEPERVRRRLLGQRERAADVLGLRGGRAGGGERQHERGSEGRTSRPTSFGGPPHGARPIPHTRRRAKARRGYFGAAAKCWTWRTTASISASLSTP